MKLLTRRHLVAVATLEGSLSLSTHRSLQRSILHRLDKNAASFENIFGTALNLVRRQFPRQSPIQFPQNDQWQKWEQFSPHGMNLRRVYAESAPLPPVGADFADFMSDLANSFWERHMFVDGLVACRTAEDVCRNFGDRYALEQANILTLGVGIRVHFGLIYRKECLRRSQNALVFRQLHINELDISKGSHADINNYANAWSNLGYLMLDFELYESALLYIDLAIHIRNKIGGNTQMNAQSMLYRGLALAGLGRWEEAIGCILDDETLQSWPEGFLKQVYVALLELQFQWAVIHLKTGNIEVAYATMREVLSSRRAYFGDTNRATLNTFYMLGIMEQKIGNSQQAE